MARIAIERSQYKEAGQLLQYCRTIRNELSDSKGLAAIMQYQAWISCEYDELETADALLQDALQIYEKDNDSMYSVNKDNLCQDMILFDDKMKLIDCLKVESHFFHAEIIQNRKKRKQKILIN